MNKEKLIEYLTKQSEKIDQKDFDLNIWKEFTSSFLEHVIGRENYYSKQIKNFDYEIKVSVDELYPKKIPDLNKTKIKLKALTQDLMDQLIVMDDRELMSSQNKGEETLSIVVESLRNSFTGNQLKTVKDIADLKDKDQKQQTMVEQIKQYDVDTVQNVLAEILTSKEIWRELTGL